MATLIGMWFCGFLTGAFLSTVLIVYIGNRILDKKEKLLLEETEVVKAKLSVSDRLKRVGDIMDEQLKLLQQADHPQKNALDGQYKNGLNRQIKDLEKEKEEVLKSIIADGHDPDIVTVTPDGVVTQQKLSGFMADSGMTMAAVPEQKKEEPKSVPRQVGKFTVYRGGKPDDTNH